MVRISFLLTFSCFLYFNAWAQRPTFSKVIESSSMLSFKKQAFDPDGYWFFIDDSRLMKVDSTGNRIWEKTLSADPLLVLGSIAATEDHRFLITAFHFTTQRLHFMIVDRNGNITSNIIATEQSTYGEHAFIGQDSLLVVGQRMNSSGQSKGFADLFNSTTGVLLWSYTSAEHAILYTGARRITNTVIGLFGSQGGSGVAKAALTLIHNDGTERWTKIYSTPSVNAMCVDVVQAYDGSLRALLRKGNTSEMLILSENGDQKDRLLLPLTVGRHIIRNEQEHSFLLTGMSRDRIFLAKLDESARVLWWRFYGSAARTEFGDAINGLTLHPGGSIILWGACRRDVQSFPFLVCADEQGLVQHALPSEVKEPQRMLNNLPGAEGGNEPQLLTSLRSEDGNMLMGGFRYKKVSDQSQSVPTGLISMVDSRGDTLWTKDLSSLLDPSREYVDYVMGGNITSSGNYALLVQGRNQGGGFSVLHMTKNGQVLWNSAPLSGKRPNMTEIAPGEFLLCGHAFDLQRYNEIGVIHKVNLNTQSATVQLATFPGCMVHNIVPSGKGTFYVTGEQIQTYEFSRKGYWAEINSNGVILASETYDLAYKTLINTTAITAQGELICAGAVEDVKGNKDLLLLCLDDTGKRKWHRTIDILHQDEAVTLKVLPTGYLVAGETGRPVFGLQQSFAYIAQFSFQGELVWQKFIGHPGTYSWGLEIHLDTDSTAILVGNSENRKPGTPQFEGTGFVEAINFKDQIVTWTEESINEELQIYPNPFKDKLVVNCRGACTVRLFTTQGKLVGKFTADQDTPALILDVQYLAEGIYIADLEKGQKRHRFRLVKTM